MERAKATRGEGQSLSKDVMGLETWSGCIYNNSGLFPTHHPISVAWWPSYRQHPQQGIERLQRKKQPRERVGSYKSVQEAFGGDFSLNWFNPFSRPCQPEIPIDKGLVRQVSSLSDMDNMETPESQLEETKDRDSVEVLDE